MKEDSVPKNLPPVGTIVWPFFSNKLRIAFEIARRGSRSCFRTKIFVDHDGQWKADVTTVGLGEGLDCYLTSRPKSAGSCIKIVRICKNYVRGILIKKVALKKKERSEDEVDNEDGVAFIQVA